MLKQLLTLLLSLFFLACSSDTPSTNHPPIADAGNYQYIYVGSTVQLDGSASYDVDHDALTYRWCIISKPEGSSATLSSPTVVAPSFIADIEGTYNIELIVNDGALDSEPAHVAVSTVVIVDPSIGPQASNEVFTPSNTLEQRPMLVIRLAFNNQHFVSDQTTWQQILFGAQRGQLNDYYHDISHDQFAFSPVSDAGNVINGITTVTFLVNHPDPDINSITFVQDLHPFLKSAIQTVSSDGFDFSIYDTNNDNSITPGELIVIFIMAGEEDAYSGGTLANGIWAHQWCTQNTYTPIVNGVSVMNCDTNGNYAIFGERHHDSLDVSHDATVGIIAHELGHSAFALPDLYDTDSAFGGVGYYGLMANGTWGQKGAQGYPGDTPTHMTAWCKINVGWYSATSTSSDIYADLPVNATGTTDYNIIKSPVSGSTNEYFLVENRSAIGYDEGLRAINTLYGGGISIWHIDEGTISANLISNSVNDDASHKGVDLEEAYAPSLDTSWGDPEKNLYYNGNKTEFTPNTLPNTNLYNNARSYIFFTDISSRSDTMTLRINNPL